MTELWSMEVVGKVSDPTHYAEGQVFILHGCCVGDCRRCQKPECGPEVGSHDLFTPKQKRIAENPLIQGVREHTGH